MKRLFLLLVFGCAGGSPAFEVPLTADGLASSTSTAAPELAPVVSMADGQLSVDGRTVLLLGADGAAPADARRGQLVNPLYDALLERRLESRTVAAHAGVPETERALLVQVQGSHPWSSVRDVLYTAGQAGFDRHQLAVAAPSGAVAVIPARSQGLEARTGPALVVGVARSGFTVSAPGAEPATASDAAALTALAVRAKDATPSAELLVLAPDDDVSWQRVVEALDAARSSGGRVLYADVALAGPKRSPPTISGSGAVAAPSGVPVVRLGEPRITGGLDHESVGHVIKRHLNQIRYCYQRELANEPTLSGEVVIAFEIAADGTVSGSRIERSTVDHEGLTTCIAGRFKRMRFPESTDGGVTSVSYPFVLVLEA